MTQLLISLALFTFPGGCGDDPLKAADKLMFQAPAGWKVTNRSESVLFYDSPEPKDAQGCRIAVTIPMEAKGDFADWFGMVQAPALNVTASNVEEGKTKAGYATLRQTRVVKRRMGELHRHYCGMNTGKHFVLILYSAPSADLLKKHLGEVEKVMESWDAGGKFPVEVTAEKKEGP